MSREASEAKAQEAANQDAADKEAFQFWGYLIKQDKCGTPLFDRLLYGIAELIVSALR